jgi:TRAP-type mannitol/chloroaromatic compound transport system permease large subunit
MADRSVRAPRLDGGADGRLADSHASSPRRLDREVWERETRRLLVTARILAAVLLALVVRAVVSGITTAIGVAGAIVAGLLVGSVALARQGRRLEPTSRKVLRD